MWHRKRFVRLLIEKDASDQSLMSLEQKEHWYTINYDGLQSEVRSLFVPLSSDQETVEFLEWSLAISNNLCLQVYYSLIASILSVFLTKTSINGFLARGRMFIFSHHHLKSLLALPDNWSPYGRRMLDIGAGDGGVTKQFAPFYSHISVVEASKIMEWRLSQRQFTVVPMDKWQQSGPYDLITALNLLDRHHISDPIELLASLHKMAKEHDCPVLLSVVLPIRQFVEFNKITGKSAPESTIPTSGSTYESQVNTLIQKFLEPAGFEVVRWTKLPYLCEGDLSQAYYELSDAVFLLRAKRMPLPIGDSLLSSSHSFNVPLPGEL